ncbi:hypothetical protein [Nocardia sp. NPDC056000]|uniref:hypothetical protein n=1 Tax=Nocardia sp. NPDC056000 TaxID=3345674 RepID=UPI0035D9E741
MPEDDPRSSRSAHSADSTDRLNEARQCDVAQLIQTAAAWMGDAMDAWTDENYAKVAVLAPLAVEHLGKAVLWQENPVLLVPFLPEAEASLVKLATAPSLAEPKLRTVGLKLLLGRLEAVIGALPLDAKRRNRMVDVRNGALHVAASSTSRYVLIDALTLCNVFLEKLDHDVAEFYGDHRRNITALVDQGRSEVQHTVDAKRARAQRKFTMLLDQLGEDVFTTTVQSLEQAAPYVLDRDALGSLSISWSCPECGCEGRLAGGLDLSSRRENGIYSDDELSVVYHSGWEIEMVPGLFCCNVCSLTLSGVQELAAADLPSGLIVIDENSLGPDFNPEQEAECLFGIRN